MKRFWAICVMVLCFTLGTVSMAQLQWTPATHRITGRSLVDPDVTDGIEIYGKDGIITIRTTRRIQVRVFTILGQLVSQAVLNPGASELKIGARGIYIVKIGNITQKVAL